MAVSGRSSLSPATQAVRAGPDLRSHAGEVLARIMPPACVHTSGANHPDALMIRDPCRTKPPRPFTSGSDVVGEDPAISPDATTFAPGDRVPGLFPFGGYATHICLDQNTVIHIPNIPTPCHLTRPPAWSWPIYGTSYHALKNWARTAKEETVLVSGTTGRVGVAKIKLAKTTGAGIIGAIPSDRP